MHNIMIYFSLNWCTIFYDLPFLTLDWKFLGHFLDKKPKPNYALYSWKSLYPDSTPHCISHSQIIELEEEEDEPKLFTKTDKKRYIKREFGYSVFFAAFPFLRLLFFFFFFFFGARVLPLTSGYCSCTVHEQ